MHFPHCTQAPGFVRWGDIGQFIVEDIHYPTALSAHEMLMAGGVGVETASVVHYSGASYDTFCFKCSQSPVYSVQRNGRKPLPHASVQCLGIGVLSRGDQLPIDLQPLMCQLQPGPPQHFLAIGKSLLYILSRDQPIFTNLTKVHYYLVIVIYQQQGHVSRIASVRDDLDVLWPTRHSPVICHLSHAPRLYPISAHTYRCQVRQLC
jgi:hypothetical protein